MPDGSLMANKAVVYSTDPYLTVNPFERNLLGPELVTDSGFDSPGAWSAGAGWTVQNSRAEALAATGTLSQGGITLVTGTSYNVSYNASDDGGGAWRVDLTGGTDVLGTAHVNSGDYNEVLVAEVGNNGVRVFVTSGTTINIDDLSIREVL